MKKRKVPADVRNSAGTRDSETGEILLDHASFSYDGKTDIFRDLSCRITTNNLFCILGPNGTGKSTLLNGIMNLLPLSSGRVLLDGKEVRSYSPPDLAKKIAYIPQSYHLIFPFRVLDLILMGRTPHLNDMNRPSAEDYDRVMDAVTALHLEPYLNRSCTQLSGGQLQMVMFARAIAQEAEFLVMDEPTSHLDYGRQMEVLEMMQTMHDRGVGVIFTSHNPDHAFMLCDTAAIMNGGTFENVGAPEEVITADVLSRIYHTDMKILHYGDDGAGRVCVPSGRIRGADRKNPPGGIHGAGRENTPDRIRGAGRETADRDRRSS